MTQATIWRTVYRVPDSLPTDIEESVKGTGLRRLRDERGGQR